MQTSVFRLSLVGVALLAAAAQGQNQFNGSDIFATGDNPPLDGFSPGSNVALQLLNDGTNGDAALNDGVWSRDFVPAAVGGRPDNLPQWKAASNGWAVTIPGGTDNSYFRPVVGESVKFVLDTRQLNDGFLPDGSLNTSGYTYTIPSPIPVGGTGVTVTAVGAFQSEIPGGASGDWDPAGTDVVLVDNGVAPDATANDGLYTAVVTGLPVAAYDFKIIINGATTGWDRQISQAGLATGGGNFSLNFLASTDNLTIVADTKKGRVKVTNDNPLANPGPPFFATSAAWGQTLDATTQLYDNGTNGDVSSGDGVYGRTFTVASITATTGVKVRDFAGNAYPNSGDGYPFATTVANQKVLVQFDTNTYADGFTPTTKYVWTDPASRRVATYVQAIGDFMVDLGGIGDWDNNASFFQLVDTGANGDAAAGDFVFGKTFAGSTSNKNWKAIGEQGSWAYQFGGNGEGYTMNGNNPNQSITATNPTFQVDTVTGRIGLGTSLPTFPPSATRLAVANSGVSDWSVY